MSSVEFVISCPDPEKKERTKKYSLDTIILAGNLMELLRMYTYAQNKIGRNLYIRTHRPSIFEQLNNQL